MAQNHTAKRARGPSTTAATITPDDGDAALGRLRDSELLEIDAREAHVREAGSGASG